MTKYQIWFHVYNLGTFTCKDFNYGVWLRLPTYLTFPCCFFKNTHFRRWLCFHFQVKHRLKKLLCWSSWMGTYSSILGWKGGCFIHFYKVLNEGSTVGYWPRIRWKKKSNICHIIFTFAQPNRLNKQNTSLGMLRTWAVRWVNCLMWLSFCEGSDTCWQLVELNSGALHMY
jgi:hypothetical protein